MENQIDEFAERIRREMTISTEEYERRKAEYVATPMKKGRKLGSHNTRPYNNLKRILSAEKKSYSYDDIRLAYKMGKEDMEREVADKLKSLGKRISDLEVRLEAPTQPQANKA